MLLDRLSAMLMSRRRMPAGRLSRRTFLSAGAAAGGGLLLSVDLPTLISGADAADAKAFAPGAFIRVDRSGQVTLIIPQVEMGQGTYTSMPMLIAEELEVDLQQVHVEHAPPDDKLYGNRLLGFQATGGSTSVRAFWEPLRRAGATARSMLVSAAAETWKVDPNSCRAENGAVIHFDRAQALLRRAGRQSGNAAGAGQGSEGSEGVQADRDARQTSRHAGQGERQGGVRHRRQNPRHEDRDSRGLSGIRWQVRAPRRQQGEGGQGRAPNRSSRQCGGCGRRSYGGREKGPGGARHRLGRRR